MKRAIGAVVNEAKKSTEKSSITTFFCDLPSGFSCPLLAKRQCIKQGLCVYGSRTVDWTDSASRANSHNAQLVQMKEYAASVGGGLALPDEKIAYIGEYVFLPYKGMAQHNIVEHFGFKHVSAGWWGGGFSFIERENFTPQVVVDMVKFVPKDGDGKGWRDRVISEYASESVPMFLWDLRNLDPELFAEAVKINEHLDAWASLLDMAWYKYGEIPVRINYEKIKVLYNGIEVDGEIFGTSSFYVYLPLARLGLPGLDSREVSKVSLHNPDPGLLVRPVDRKEALKWEREQAKKGN